MRNRRGRKRPIMREASLCYSRNGMKERSIIYIRLTMIKRLFIKGIYIGKMSFRQEICRIYPAYTSSLFITCIFDTVLFFTQKMQFYILRKSLNNSLKIPINIS